MCEGEHCLKMHGQRNDAYHRREMHFLKFHKSDSASISQLELWDEGVFMIIRASTPVSRRRRSTQVAHGETCI